MRTLDFLARFCLAIAFVLITGELIKCTFLQNSIDHSQANFNYHNIVLRIDNDFTSNQKDIIESCIQEWNDHTKANISFYYQNIAPETIETIKTDHIPTIYQGISWFNWKKYIAMSSDSTTPLSVGLALIDSGDIFILSKYHFRAIVLHEIGHILIGTSWHSKNINSTMYPLVGVGLGLITDEEIKLVNKTIKEK